MNLQFNLKSSRGTLDKPRGLTRLFYICPDLHLSEGLARLHPGHFFTTRKILLFPETLRINCSAGIEDV